jgi:hypothetical protein
MGGGLAVSEQCVVMVVALHDVSALERDLLAEGGRHAVDDGADNLMLRVLRINDVSTDIGNHPYVLRCQGSIRMHAHLVDLRDIAQVTEVGREAKTGSLG